ncbi:MAG: biotin/lipoyl-binding protein [Deltaproteobacteria bacterium]|nr:MAG: biotin/lipoyl-binding protein [Deltaproteobacteria bacterium]
MVGEVLKVKTQNVRVWALLLFLILSAGCERKSSAAKVQTKDARDTALAVTVVPVRNQKVQRSVEFVGTLEANDQVTVSSEVDGQVASIAADFGDRVKQGQLLAKIRETEFRFAETSLSHSGSRKGSTAGLRCHQNFSGRKGQGGAR